MVLPLTLTPFEYYYWCDDHPACPTTFPMELQFQGRLDREKFEQALTLALARHPLLTARVETKSGEIPRWVAASEMPHQLDWADATQPIDGAGRFLDLTKTSGLRGWVREGTDRSRLVLQFHHACCDALGGLQFVEDLLVAYSCLVTGQDCHEVLRPLDVERLRRRDDYGLSDANYRANLRDTLTTARIWAGLLFRQPTRLAVNKHNGGTTARAASELGYLTHALPSDQVTRLRAVASQSGVTLNDLLLRDLFLAVHDWNRRQGEVGSQRLAINIPVNLRIRDDRRMPAANILGFWFVSRDQSCLTNPSELLRSIHVETEAVKKWRLPLYFLGGLRFATWAPKVMRWALRRDHSFATVVFSNTGRVLARTPLKRRNHKIACGNVIVDRITGVPPIRPGTRAAIAVVNYGQEMTINLRCDPTTFDAQDTYQLLAIYVEQIQQTIDGSESNSAS